MDKFADIRPYNDTEVVSVIERILADDECVSAIVKLKYPNCPAWLMKVLAVLVRFFVKRQMRGVNTINDFQVKLEHYLSHMIDKKVTQFTVSGLEQLDRDMAYVFISNHRDITLDAAFVNLARYKAGLDTVRIAIGDNLLTKAFAADLMRLNKSFIVKRSERAPRKLLAALKLLSEYIRHSIQDDNHSVWIAQREGRAKDGMDITDAAILKMLAIHKGRKNNFSEVMQSLNIVPVTISYEYDPCDALKARELAAIAADGEYIKSEQEDVASIAEGIEGYKGAVHLSFGKPFSHQVASVEELAQWIDDEIIGQYVLHSSNVFAYQALYNETPDVIIGAKQCPFVELELSEEKQFFDERMSQLSHTIKQQVLAAYANPVVNKLNKLRSQDERA